MKSFWNKIHRLLNNKYALFCFTVVLFWIKTCLIYLTQFRLDIANAMQQFLLIINPISSILLFFGVAVIFKGKLRLAMLLFIDFSLSVWLYANVVYYRFFSDFITLPTMMQSNNFGDIGGSMIAELRIADVLMFADTLILLALVFFRVVRPAAGRWRPRAIVGIFMSAVMVFIVNLSLAEADRPDLLMRTFDRHYIVKYLGAFNFFIYDTIQNTRSSAQSAFADSSDINGIENYTKGIHAEPNPEYFAKAKGMNVIQISLESLQNFAVGYRMPDGREVTPFLNSLADGGKGSYYFPDFFHQTGQGRTSDAEFMMENSLFPLSQGPVFQMKDQNTYQATPAILDALGYETAVFHGNNKSFWNRDKMYKSLGFQKFFDAEYYSMTKENKMGYGMKDKPFFKESMPYLANLKEPFYSKFILLSNHHPFGMEEGDTDFPVYDFGDEVVNNYFQSANYMDQAVEQFFGDLKKAGLLDHTVVVMYGDHDGITSNHNEAMAKVLGKEEITPFDEIQLQRVPLFIYVPKTAGGTVATYGGDVDVRPTLLHLLGIETKDYIQFGTDLFSKEHRQIVPFRDGDVVTRNYTITGKDVYDNKTGKTVDKEKGSPYVEEAKKELELSDSLIYGDLLRFYHPKGFVAPDPSKINYNADQTEQD